MSNVISLAARLAEKASNRAEAFRKRALADDLFDEDELETYRDMRRTAQELEGFADLQDMAYSIGRVGFTDRNIRRVEDFLDNGPSAA